MLESIKNIDKKPNTIFILSISLVLGLRIIIYFWLHAHGYFYGIPWDSFSRALISYDWSRQPFFALSDGYWLPLQFWLVGSIYALISAWIPTSEILVPVIINNIFFLGSLVVIYKLTIRITSKPWLALIACLLAGIFSGDIFISYTALSEPMLLFFMLVVSYFFYEMAKSDAQNHSKYALKAAIMVSLAAATHYIGWFLAIFFSSYLVIPLIRSIDRKNIVQATCYFLAIFLCVVVPLGWLFHSYLVFGNPFYPAQQARQMQAAFIGQMALIKRILAIPWVLIKEFYPVIIPGAIAFIVLFFKQRKSLVYWVPMGFVLVMIWVSTAMAFSAPYQEPRYLVFVGWAFIPVIAMAIDHLWQIKSSWSRPTICLAFTLVVVFNAIQISSFQNSFGKDVQTTALQARVWLTKHPEPARMILNQDSFAETGVIPLISGYPDRIILVSNQQIATGYADPKAYLSRLANPWLCVTKDQTFANDAANQGLIVQKSGSYFRISP